MIFPLFVGKLIKQCWSDCPMADPYPPPPRRNGCEIVMGGIIFSARRKR